MLTQLFASPFQTIVWDDDLRLLQVTYNEATANYTDDLLLEDFNRKVSCLERMQPNLVLYEESKLAYLPSPQLTAELFKRHSEAVIIKRAQALAWVVPNMPGLKDQMEATYIKPAWVDNIGFHTVPSEALAWLKQLAHA